MLDKEFQYYLDNQDTLVEKYDGRYVAIIGEEVVGDYDDYSHALSHLLKNHEMGTFLVKNAHPAKKITHFTFTRALDLYRL